MSGDSNRNPFRFVELVVLVSVVVFLGGLVLNWLGRQPAPVGVASCRSNQRQIFTAVMMYDTVHGHLPPLRSMGRDGQVVNWPPPLLKELGRPDLYDDFAHGKDGDDARQARLPDAKGIATYLDILKCPIEPRDDTDNHSAPLSYVLNGGLENQPGTNRDYRANGVFDDLGSDPARGGYRPGVRNGLAYVAVHDGGTHTVMLTENVTARSWHLADTEYEAAVLWRPVDPGPRHPREASGRPAIGLNQDLEGPLDADHARPSSRHGGGFVVTFCDGSVRFIDERIDYFVWARLMTCDGANTRSPYRDKAVAPILPYQSRPVADADVITKEWR